MPVRHSQRADGPGMAEVHLTDTDITYALEGSATLITGGTVVDGKTVADNEIRGASLQGGEPHSPHRGDVLVVPHGVPHWFKQASTPFNYYVVKAH
jgi:mannose-6-phosphate isomerase-like protein (cupin superfamily)